MKNNTFSLVCLLAFVVFLAIISCNDEDKMIKNSLSSLPLDTGGVQIAYPLSTSSSPLGYYVYIPSGYETSPSAYPLLVFLHGSGERGDSEANPDDLDKVLRNGPPKLIERGEWSPKYPMVVVSPQTNDGLWDAAKIHAVIKFIVGEYNINKQRIYLTGLSLGGGGTFSYVQAYADTGYVAAAVPISGWAILIKLKVLGMFRFGLFMEMPTILWM